jgi:CubicO group peptidase (beta-lactamase class C family)
VRNIASSEDGHSRRRALLGGSAAWLLAGTGALCRAAPDDLRLRLKEALGALPIPGVSLVLLQGGQFAGSAHCGVLVAGAAAPVNGETVFEAASMSKPVFAYLALQQVQRGRLDLDRPVMHYLPQEVFKPPQPWQRLITARMLLTHRAGLPNWRSDAEEATGALRIASAPGERFSYSGEGYFYLQRVLEQITGEPMQALAERELFKPLGMVHSSFSSMPPRLAALRARGHDAQGRPLPPSHYAEANAAYTLSCSAEDYARFMAELLREDRSAAHSLSASMLQAMVAHETVADDREPIARAGRASGTAVFWGLGWAINSTAQGDIVYHTGTNSSGFRNYCQFSPSRRSGMVMMSNSLAGNQLWPRLLAQIGDL